MFNYAIYASHRQDVIVITSSKNIIKACEYFKISCISHKRFTFKQMITDHIEVKRKVNDLIETIGNDPLHFSHTQFAVFCFILVSAMFKIKKKIVFHDFEYVYKKKHFSLFSKDMVYISILVFLMKVLYHVPLEIRDAGKALPISMPLDYILSNASQVMNEKDRYFLKTLEGIKETKMTSFKIDSILIDQGFDQQNYYIQDEVSKIIELITDYNVEIKAHPKMLSKYLALFKTPLPEYVPVEFYFPVVNNCVISCHSSSLITATHFDNLKVISLIDIIGKNNDIMREARSHLLENGNDKILFPKNIKELRELLEIN